MERPPPPSPPPPPPGDVEEWAGGAEPTGKEARQTQVLDPAGRWCHRWSLVVSLAFLYNFWALSYRFAFQEIDQASLALWFALDYSADLVYLADILVSCRTGYLEEGVLVRNRTKTRHHYQECTRFYLDCLCLLPLDILYLTLGFNSIVRCLRLVKIYKFWNFLDRTERHTNYPNLFRTCTLVHYILVIFHWNACLFHMISKKNILDIQNLYSLGGNQEAACPGTLCQYLHAFYWSSLALTLVGDLPRPRTHAEYLYLIVELFLGLFLVATVLGHVSNIVTNVSAARKEFQARLDAVKTFMRMRRVSDKLQDKVIRWFDYLWITQKSSDEERSVACLPDRLKAEIAIHVHLDTLRRVDIFQNTEAGFLCELVLRLKLVLFSPGDYVCRKNEVGHEMYIVSRGHLEVLTDSNSGVVATLGAGSYFGEISVLNVGLAGNKRTASVRSVGYSDLFCLNKQDLWDVLKNYPNAEARIRARAQERLEKLDIRGKRVGNNAADQPARSTQQLTCRHGRPLGNHHNHQPAPTCSRSHHHRARHRHMGTRSAARHADWWRRSLTHEHLLTGGHLSAGSCGGGGGSSEAASDSVSWPAPEGAPHNDHVEASSSRHWLHLATVAGRRSPTSESQLTSGSLSGAPSSSAEVGAAAAADSGKPPGNRRRGERHRPPGAAGCWHTKLREPHQPAAAAGPPTQPVLCWLASQQQPTALLQVPRLALAPSPVCSQAASFRSQRQRRAPRIAPTQTSAAASLEGNSPQVAP